MAKSTTSSRPPDPSAISNLIAKSAVKDPRDALPLEILHNLRHQHGWTDLRLHTLDHPPSSTHSSASSTPTLTSTPTLSSTSSLTSTSAMPDLDLTHTTTYQTSAPAVPNNTNTATSPKTTLISGFPTSHAYIHPDLQSHLLLNSISETTLSIQREYVLPMSLGEKWTLSRLCDVFDQLDDREVIRVVPRPPAEPPTTNTDHENDDTVDINPSSNSSTSTNLSTSASANTANANAGASRRQSQPQPRAQRTNPTPHPFIWRDSKRVLMGMQAHNGVGGDGTIVYYIIQEGEVKPRQNG